MNNFIIRALGVGVALTTLATACKKDEVKAVVTPTNQPSLTASTSTVVLAQTNATQNAVTFTWAPITTAVSGTSSSVAPGSTYQIQFAKAGTNFASPVSVDAGTSGKTTLLVSDLNNSLQLLGLPAGTATPVDARLVARLAANTLLTSPTVSLTATTYTFCAQPKKAWGIVGPAGPGWPGGPIDFVMTYDCKTQTYTYTGPLTADQFKFRLGYNWNNNLGGTGPNTPLAGNGANLSVAAAGNYTVVLYNASDSTKLASAYYTIK